MLNTRELEKRWLRYKIKSVVFPSAIIVLSLTTIFIVSYFYFLNTPQEDTNLTNVQKQMEVKNDANKELADSSSNNIPTISNIVDTDIEGHSPVPQEKVTTTKKVVLKPSLNFIKNMQESSAGYYNSTPEEKTFDTTYANPKPTKKIEQETFVEEEVVLASEKPKKIVIAKETSIADIKDAEKRFKKNNNPALSLFLAKQYYAKGDYSKSYNYALRTNQLDKDNEDSWLIFSRSLVKLGKPNLAKKALKEYIKYSHSNNAELLLDDIMTGKFQ